MQDGIYDDITNEQYHSDSAISRSQLMDYVRCPAYYKAVHIDKVVQKEQTTDMIVGSLTHTLVLEPHKFNDEYYLIEQKKRPAKGTKAHDKILDEAGDRRIITQSDMDLAVNMATALSQDDQIRQLISGEFEHSIFYTHEKSEMQCKSRPDIIFNQSTVVDVKTTQSNQFIDFSRSAVKFGYYIQAAMAYDALKSIGREMKAFFCVCTEKQPPHLTRIFMFDDDSIERACDYYSNVLCDLKQSIENNYFPGYGVETLYAPPWAFE